MPGLWGERFARPGTWRDQVEAFCAWCERQVGGLDGLGEGGWGGGGVGLWRGLFLLGPAQFFCFCMERERQIDVGMESLLVRVWVPMDPTEKVEWKQPQNWGSPQLDLAQHHLDLPGFKHVQLVQTYLRKTREAVGSGACHGV